MYPPLGAYLASEEYLAVLVGHLCRHWYGTRLQAHDYSESKGAAVHTLSRRQIQAGHHYGGREAIAVELYARHRGL